jgi:hypothetical protein
VQTEVVARCEPAPPFTHEKAAPLLLARFRQGAAKQQVQQKVNLVVSFFNSGKTAAGRILPGARRTGRPDSFPRHGGSGLLDTPSIAIQQSPNGIIAHQAFRIGSEEILRPMDSIQNRFIRPFDSGQIVLPFQLSLKSLPLMGCPTT